MNKPKSNKAWRIGWLVLSVLEFIDDEGRIFNELKKFKKEE